MRLVGRIIARKGNTAGIFVPMLEGFQHSGVYQITETLDEFNIKHLGPSAMAIQKFEALDLNGLYVNRGMTGLTPKELDEVMRHGR